MPDARPPLATHAYWLDELSATAEEATAFPASVDVLIVGSGYTGLHAAIETSRAGRHTVVIDSQAPGHGCSTRNGGQISTSIKPSLEKLAQRYGRDKARAIRAEGVNALDWIGRFIESEALDCDFRRAGRFHAAHTPAHYERLVRDVERLQQEEDIESHVVTRSEQHRELGSDSYFGGVVFPRHCSLQPAKYHQSLMQLARTAGAAVFGHCTAERITRTARGFQVSTSRGVIVTRELVLATNGYTTALLPWLQRRIVPINSYIIVTEPLPETTVDTLFPTDRIASDTRKIIYYYRATPDRRRIAFGGRVLANEADAALSAPRLGEVMGQIFPLLDGVGITHAWAGTVAYSFDELAHTGIHDGIHYAGCYCGSGVSMASYLGMRLGQTVLGRAAGKTAFAHLPHPTRPLYRGKPWFLPAIVGWYRWRDARGVRRARARSRL